MNGPAPRLVAITAIAFASLLGLAADLVAATARAGEPVGLTQEKPDAVLVKARASYKKALGLVQAGKNEAALTAFEAVLEPLADEPNSADLFYNLVQVARALKRWDKVLLYGQGFLARDGDSADARAMGTVIELAKTRLTQAGTTVVELTIAAPAEAQVRVDHTPVRKGDKWTLWLAPGAHRVQVKQAGFVPYDAETTLLGGAVGAANVVVVLDKLVLKGKLEVKAKPAEGVQVFVDDQLQGVTPLPPIELEAKRCLVRFEKPGYGSWLRYVVIEPNATTVVSPVLEKAAAAP